VPEREEEKPHEINALERLHQEQTYFNEAVKASGIDGDWAKFYYDRRTYALSRLDK